ncbi:MAG: Gfo/Idh/MocA family oxidoreductase, partial [Pseudomonadota bacterium]|nr:Gfo/Idh/MocA family oxidoreductase [Pseudomonadota bacterium]
MSEISIGLIGAGMMGQEHIQNFNLLDGVCVGANADTHAGMRDKAAAMCPHKVQAVSDFEKLLGDPSLDALVIATPNFHHIDVLRSALETGKPILCEKPLCTTLDDTREIVT